MVSPSFYVEVEGEKIGLDNGYYKKSFLSHAHSDHTRGLSRVEYLISSKETSHILGLNKKEFKSKRLEMRNAGHILGAKQLVAEEDGRRTVYTGDLRLRDGIIEKGGEIIECDRLIIDGTYSKKIFKFPDPQIVYSQIQRAVSYDLLSGHSILFASYPLGKSQEIIKVLNEIGIVPYVDEKVNHFSKKYVELGVKLEFELLTKIPNEPFVFLTTPRKVNPSISYIFSQRFGMIFKRYIASGWGLRFRYSKFHRKFILSDHLDYYDILKYIELSNAKEVILFSTKESDLIRELKGKVDIKIM